MCRYAEHSYKPHYACFECRKTFKRRLIYDIDRDKQANDSAIAKCPQCGNLMANMGKDFEAPKQRDVKAWKHIQSLYKADVTFHSCGCTGPGYIPKDTEALVTYLERIKEQYHKQREFWARRKAPETEAERQREFAKDWAYLLAAPKDVQTGTRKKGVYDHDKAVAHWVDMISQVEEKITQITAT